VDGLLNIIVGTDVNLVALQICKIRYESPVRLKLDQD
jgi:hypothetical protein